MKRSWIIIGGIILVIAAAVVYVALSGNKVSSPKDTYATDLPAPTSTEPPTPQPQPQAQAQPGTYKTYDAEVVAKDSGRKVLFFHAPWCPQCRALEQSIQAGAIPDDVTIYKVDFDTAHDLRTKYGVNLQTTLVEIDGAGAEVKKYVAYNSPTLEAVIQNLGLK